MGRDAMGDYDQVPASRPALHERVVEALALRIADLRDLGRPRAVAAVGRVHFASMRAINRSTASATKAGSSAWVLRSTTGSVPGTRALSSAKNAASLAGSLRGPPGFA